MFKQFNKLTEVSLWRRTGVGGEALGEEGPGGLEPTLPLTLLRTRQTCSPSLACSASLRLV